MFWSKKPQENVNATCQEQINKINTKITRMESEILDLITSQDIIRNKVLRKIQVKKQVEEEEDSNIWEGIPIK
jgi:hypothetical protein